MHIISKQKKSLVLGIYIKFHSTIGAITLEKKGGVSVTNGIRDSTLHICRPR